MLPSMCWTLRGVPVGQSMLLSMGPAILGSPPLNSMLHGLCQMLHGGPLQDSLLVSTCRLGPLAPLATMHRDMCAQPVHSSQPTAVISMSRQRSSHPPQPSISIHLVFLMMRLRRGLSSNRGSCWRPQLQQELCNHPQYLLGARLHTSFIQSGQHLSKTPAHHEARSSMSWLGTARGTRAMISCTTAQMHGWCPAVH